MQQSQLELRERRDFGEVISDTFQFFRLNLKSLLRPALYIAGPFLLIAAIFFTVSYVDVITRMNSFEGPGTYYYLNMVFGFIFIVVGIALLYAILHDYVKLLLNGYRKEDIKVADLWKLVRRDVWKAIGVNIVLAIMFFMLAFILSIVTTLAGPVGVLFKFIGILGLIFLGVRISLAHAAALVESYPVFDSIGRAWNMTRNMFWMTLGTIFILGIMILVISYLFYIPILILGVIIGINGGSFTLDPATRIIVIVCQVAAYLAMFMGYMIPATGLIFQYLNCVERKEGHGLLARIDRMELGADESHWGQEEY